jgi:hypothetical protein
MKPNEITLDFKTPIVISENQIILSKLDGTVVLAFVQFNDLQTPSNGHVVAAVELKNLKVLEDFSKSIEEHIRKEKTKET